MKPEYIILHHSLTKDNKTVSWNAIRRYHTKVLNWNGIGYHWGIELIGEHYEFLVGRMSDRVGAHTRGMNSESIGICFVGNYDINEISKGMWIAGIRLVSWLQRVYNIPTINVRGHRDFSGKTCPGKNFDLDLFRTSLSN